MFSRGKIAEPEAWMDQMPCQERDRIILAFVLAVNAHNHVTSSVDPAADVAERSRMKASIDAGWGHCHELRDRLLSHCKKHGC